MIGDKIIIRLNPTEVFQQFYVYEKGERVEKIGVTMEDFTSTLTELIGKYGIYTIDVSGNHTFSKKIIQDFLANAPVDFVYGELTIRYL